MSFSYVAAGAATSFSTATTANVARASNTAGYFMAIIIGVEGVASGSGPWVSPNTTTPGTSHIGSATGWRQACYQAPSATGNGLEVWVAVNGGTGAVDVDFASSVTGIAQMFAWSGEYEPNGSINDGALRAAVTAQVTGDNPAAPSVYTFVDEMVVVCGADQLASPGYGTPSGTPAFTKRDDQKRSGSFGNVEITVADRVTVTEGDTGSIPWTATASSGTTKGATATLAIRPAAGASTPPTKTSPLIRVEYD